MLLKSGLHYPRAKINGRENGGHYSGSQTTEFKAENRFPRHHLPRQDRSDPFPHSATDFPRQRENPGKKRLPSTSGAGGKARWGGGLLPRFNFVLGVKIR